jgi:hypothetical protein
MILYGHSTILQESDLHSIAAFAFKTTVVANHMRLYRKPFFTDVERRHFARELEIPDGFQMWLSSRKSIAARTGIFKSSYGVHRHPRCGFEFYTCTFGIGYFVFQTVSGHWTSRKAKRSFAYRGVKQGTSMSDYAIPAWPFSRPVAWPPLRPVTDSMIADFCNRFDKLDVPLWMTQ